MRKKLTAILLAFVCLLALTACGASSTGEEPEISADLSSMLFSQAESDAQQMDMIVKAGQIEESKSDSVVYAGLQGWETAMEEIGEVDFSADADGNGVADSFTEKSIVPDDDGNYIVTVGVKGSQRDADLVITYKKDLSGYVSIATNVTYTFNELMQQAGLNTLLGMGTTFAVLILLSLIIALFGKLLTSFMTDRKNKEEAKEAAEANAARNTAAAASDLTSAQGAGPEALGDGQLIAVIAAAIAAIEADMTSSAPAAAEGDYIVRRIRRIRKK